MPTVRLKKDLLMRNDNDGRWGMEDVCCIVLSFILHLCRMAEYFHKAMKLKMINLNYGTKITSGY